MSWSIKNIISYMPICKWNGMYRFSDPPYSFRLVKDMVIKPRTSMDKEIWSNVDAALENVKHY